jgi:hypothetical protein
MDLKNMLICGLDLAGRLYGQVARCCKRGNETWDSIKGEDFFFLVKELLASQEGVCCVELEAK